MKEISEIVIPTHDDSCVSSIVPAVVGGRSTQLVSDEVVRAKSVVLLVVDGMGWNQVQERKEELPFLRTAPMTSISTVAPSTTATALTSICTGVPPGEHGVVGYKVPVAAGLLNCLRWTSGSRSLTSDVPPVDFQPVEPFLGTSPSVVTRAEFRNSGFTQAHLRGGEFCAWWSPATLVTEVIEQVNLGRPFVYAYYDGLDKVAHVYGLGAHYLDELRFVDALIERIAEQLPEGSVLLVTSDHGMVEVGDNLISLGDELVLRTSSTSGEARFLWLHAKEREASSLLDTAQCLADVAWVASVEQILDERWFGAVVTPEARSRMGDIAVVAKEDIALLDPRSPDSPNLVARHGSMTANEMLVPFIEVIT